MKDFKTFFEEANDRWKRFNKNMEPVNHRHMGIDGNTDNRQLHNIRFVPKYKQTKKQLAKNGNITQSQAEEIAKRHGLNLHDITTTKGKVLRGTRPPEILLRNPAVIDNPNCPYPFIKKIK